MARAGGSATLSGVEYQVLYTASRLAEAITEDGIIYLRPEAHHAELPSPVDGQSTPGTARRPAVDDLLVVHQNQPTEYISLKYRDGHGSWDVKQLIGRNILHDFFKQYQQDATARLLLVTQSPFDRNLDDCIERAKSSLHASLEADLGKDPFAVFMAVESYLQQKFADTNVSRSDTLRFLRQIELHPFPAPLLTENLLLRLQPRTTNALATKNSLTALALRAGANQLVLTPALIRHELVQEGHPLILPPRAADVLAQLRQASTSLTSEPATIGHLPAHHIPRAEVAELLAWVQNPLPLLQPGQSVASQKSKILIGGAGVGKTVLARAICLALQEQNIPVLGLKADRVKGSTKGELLSQIERSGLTYPLQQALTAVASPERPAIVIIDQLDALSMCLSAERGSLNSYTELLAELYELSNIRFILSCRTFDLQHDPDLASFKEAQRVEVPLLSLAQVETALQATGVAENLAQLPALLQELLRVPLHLALYCALDAEDRIGAPIISLQGLYERLFDQFLIRRNRLPENVDSNRVKGYLTSMAQAMHIGQTLTLPKFQYREQDVEVFEYLRSRGVLTEAGPAGQHVAFFHQSFFEYLFARQFVASGQSLAAFVLGSGQGLFQRSLIQQVQVYLRGANSAAYQRALRELLSSASCRFHIKLLLTQLLGSQLTPQPEELAIAQELILCDATLRLAFLEAVSAQPWLTWLSAPPILSQLLPEIVPVNDAPAGRTLFWRLATYMPGLALERVADLPESDFKNEWLILVLRAIKQFDSPLFPTVFDCVFPDALVAQQQFEFWHIIQEAISERPEWVAAKAYDQLADWPNPSKEHSQHEGYSQAQVFKDLFKVSPTICFNLCSKLLRTWVRRANYYQEPLFRGWKAKFVFLPPPHFLERDLADRKREPHNASEAAHYYAWEYLVNLASTPDTAQQRIIKKWLHSRTKTFVQIALAAVARHPEPFTDAVVVLFNKPGWLAEVAFCNHLGYYSLVVLPLVWDAATASQRAQLANTLASRAMLVDEEIYKQEEQRRFCNRFGRATLRCLLALTPARLTDFPDLLRLHQHLLRKWGDIPNPVPGPSIRITSVNPSPARRWKTEALTPANWLKVLSKYRGKERSFTDDGGTYEGLLQHMNELIKAQPSAWEPKIQYLLDQHDASVASLLSTLSEANPILAEPLINQAHQQGQLTDEAVSRLRYQSRSNQEGEQQPATPADIYYYLEQIRNNLDSEPTISGDKIDLATYALNSPGGSAVIHLLQETLSEDALPEVLETLRLVASQGSRFVRAGAVYQIAMLLKTKAVPTEIAALFIKLIGLDYTLLEPGLWSLQYLVWRDYDATLSLFRQAINEPVAHKPMTKILTVMWGHHKSGAFELLEELWVIDPDLRATSLEQLMEGYYDWPDKQVFFDAFALFLSPTPPEKLRRVYDSVFIDFPSTDFNKIAPLLQPYLEGCAPEFDRDHFIVDYLAKNVRNHPVACIGVLATLFAQIPVTRSYWPAKQGLEVLIEAYTGLSHHAVDNADCEAALDLFDQLLARPDCREELDKVLTQVQSPL